MDSRFRRTPRRAFLIGALLASWLVLTSGAHATERDAFQTLLRQTGLPVALPAGAATSLVGAGAASASIVLMAQGPAVPSASSAWTPPVGGPGQWTQVSESMSPKAQRYQTQITGAPEGWTYRVKRGPGPTDHVDFDGFKDGVLLEIKGPGYWKLLQKMYGQEWFRGAKKMLAQAESQFDVAGETPIRWHFAESEVADLMRTEFDNAGLKSIKIVHTPAVP